MCIKKIFIIKADIPDDAKPGCDDAEFNGITEMPVDVYLLDGRIGGGMGRHRAIGSFVRSKESSSPFAFLKVFSCLMIWFAYWGLFSVTHASIPEVSKRIMDAFSLSIRWQIGSVRSTSLSNMDCKSHKKSCLNRMNLEASGTTEKPLKSRSSWEYFRNTIRRKAVGIEKISCNNKAFSIG